jgi:hypothetical protein
MRFDTDSEPVKTDNCSTRTMSCSIHDFLPDTLRPVKDKNLHGFGGSLIPISHQGTIKWSFIDDNVMKQTLLIPKSLYVPTSAVRLLSPQHVSQQRNDDFPMKHGTRCITYHDKIQLQWNQRRVSVTAKLDRTASNVGTLWNAPGYSRMSSFCTSCANPEPPIITFA